jgi:hypothetical protein
MNRENKKALREAQTMIGTAKTILDCIREDEQADFDYSPSHWKKSARGKALLERIADLQDSFDTLQAVNDLLDYQTSQPTTNRRRSATMASFEEIMNMPATSFKPPQPSPPGTYHCLIDGPLVPGKSSQKGTEFLQAKLKILEAMKDVNAQVAAEQQVVGKIINYDLYITDNNTYRLTQFAVDCGIDVNGKSIKEVVAEFPGKQVLATIRHELGQDQKRVFMKVDRTARA